MNTAKQPHILQPVVDNFRQRHAQLEARRKMRMAAEMPVELPKLRSTVAVPRVMIVQAPARSQSPWPYAALALAVAIAGILTIAYRPPQLATPQHEWRDYAPAR